MFATRKVIALTRLNKIYRQNESSNVNEIKPDRPGHCQKGILIHRVALDFPLRLRNKVHFISRIGDGIGDTSNQWALASIYNLNIKEVSYVRVVISKKVYFIIRRLPLAILHRVASFSCTRIFRNLQSCVKLPSR